jgi:hypothetical protein
MFLVAYIRTKQEHCQEPNLVRLSSVGDRRLPARHWALPNRVAAPALADLRAAGVYPTEVRGNGRIAMTKTIIPKSLFAAGVLAVAMGSGVPAGQAEGWRHEPWCAVIEYEADVTWDCSYRTFEACYPNVIAGNKGFCNPNPDFVAAAPAATHKPRKRHAQN